MNENLRIAVVGATGVVGREVVSALFDREVEAEQLTVLASERSRGETLDYGEETLVVEEATPTALEGHDLVLLATPAEVSRTLVPALQKTGAWVVDVSAAFRADGSVPLVLPGFNSEVLDGPLKGRLVALPSAVTTALACVIEPLRRAFGVAQVQVTALMGVSAGGNAGVRELEQQTAALLSGREPEAGLLPQRVGFNLVPQVGPFMAQSPWTEEEAGWTLECARLFAPRGEVPVVAGTAVQVPTFHGHGLSLQVRLKKPAPVEQARAALKGSPAVKVLDAPGEKVYPMPSLVTADPTIHVGRLRAFPQAPEWLTLFATVDNVGRGAALNLVEAGLRLAARPG
ncbi:aspartate-semialdehyde dehydrogenase [Archangium primigenium]|uniref:aspartate-semialdehyde dehydrogenase n=1 Tax=[Archangium] primigenium TaxID=2792470 RepID=UPI00195ADA1A|nr:aspartate-semialdehyde dehydrogenase [Archangium primigenium]MBM7114786.1 aspartate-semialdehyde dehydrogenase [Archangium primigenium]